jgi:transposase
MRRFQISEEEYKAIKQAEKETNDKNISRRLRVLMLRHDGYKAREVAKMVGMRLNSVSQLCRRYREQGLEEFKRNKYTSHRQALPVEQEEEILSRFEKAAEAGQEVTAQEIKAAFDEAVGRDTGNSYIYVLLKRHNWRKVKPRPKHPKAANEEACEASKKLSKMCWKREKTCPRTQKDACV